MVRRYAELSPAELDTAIEEKPLAILPIGALEWHGPHLPLGLDGIVAEWFCERLAERTRGVLLPCLWTPLTTLPHKYSLDFPSQPMQDMTARHFEQLGGAGYKAVCCVTGHYAQGHMVCLYNAALRALPAVRVFAASPLEPLGQDGLLDHAARWETAQLLAIRPELVNASLLPDDPTPHRAAVLGDDPRLATAADGNRILDRGLEAWSRWADRIMSQESEGALREFLEARRASYDAYADKHKPEGRTWEDAILSWWNEQS